MLEDFLLVLLVEALEQFDGVVGLQLANAFRDGLGFQLFEDLLADGVVNLVERGEVEIGAGQFDQPDAVVGGECGDQVAQVRLMQFRDLGTQERLILGRDRSRNDLDRKSVV